MTIRTRGFARAVGASVVLLATMLVLAATAEAFVYWSGHGVIGRANPDGTGVDPFFFPRGIRGQACGLAVTDTHLYWASRGRRRDSAIGRANLDGSAAERNFIAGADYPTGLAVDASYIYWANNEETIARAELDGTGVEKAFIADVSARAVAVDESYIYWADRAGTIGRANLDGSGVDPDFIEDVPEVYGLAVDPDYVYWASWLGGPSTNSIGRANLDGTAVDQDFITGRLYGPDGVALHAGHIYWADFFGETIGRANLNGTGVKTRFMRGTYTQPCAVAVDSLRSFSVVAVERNVENGTARLTLDVPARGALELARTARVKGAEKRVGAGIRRLLVRPRGSARARLKARGWASVPAKLTYTPKGAGPRIVASTLTKWITLRRRG
jgi:hypothetical protein